jgi:tRNA wybutosine-synthesizing protein 2
MFAPGNGTERMRFSQIKFSRAETVVDMFAGLGYFTIPLSSANKERIVKYVAIEKNPTSFGYLSQNLALNCVDGVVEAINGDNRIVANDLCGKCDRILMGYLPNTKDFLPRAFEFAKKGGCILHYHYTAKKNESEEVAMAEFTEALDHCKVTPQLLRIIELSKVKNYAPHLFHYCADVELVI